MGMAKLPGISCAASAKTWSQRGLPDRTLRPKAVCHGRGIFRASRDSYRDRADEGSSPRGDARRRHQISTNQNRRHMREDGRPIASRLATDEEILKLAGVLGELNRGSVQSRGTLGIARPAEQDVDLFHRIAATSGRPVIWQSIAHRHSAPELWRKLLDLAQESLSKGAPSYPLCNARLFNGRFTLKNAQTFDDLPSWKQVMFLPLEQRAESFRDPEVRRKLRFEAVEDTRPTNFSRRSGSNLFDQGRAAEA